jgi:hypothetical protein
LLSTYPGRAYRRAGAELPDGVTPTDEDGRVLIRRETSTRPVN